MSEHIIHISDNAAKRIAHLLADEPKDSYLRISILGGGCSGFQYHFDFDTTAPTDEDRRFDKNGAQLVIDETSLEMLHDSMVDYVETLGSAAFEIKNPQAAASCGCGNSFAIAE